MDTPQPKQNTCNVKIEDKNKYHPDGKKYNTYLICAWVFGIVAAIFVIAVFGGEFPPPSKTVWDWAGILLALTFLVLYAYFQHMERTIRINATTDCQAPS